ncbi:MAG: hypothetical protein QOG62_343 [Thermoleophilaceae bacterium]|jgi:xanthine/uracil permease|nr:hypothetical protein [Thermoleophilaceae bacterium]
MPRRFPIAQWPNPPLWAAIAAWVVSRLADGLAGAIAEGLFYLAIGAWAYLEIAEGVNWFRRLLGAVVAGYLAVRLGMRLV